VATERETGRNSDKPTMPRGKVSRRLSWAGTPVCELVRGLPQPEPIHCQVRGDPVCEGVLPREGERRIRSRPASNYDRASETRHQLRNGHVEGSSQQFQIANADFLPSVLQVRDETPVHSHVFSHINLRPLSLLAESPKPLSKPDTNIGGHAPDYGCRLSTINRL